MDRVGRIVIGSGTSGHGFKFGPLLGEWLADLATGARPGPRGAAVLAKPVLPRRALTRTSTAYTITLLR